jgi:hypothetical protein
VEWTRDSQRYPQHHYLKFSGTSTNWYLAFQTAVALAEYEAQKDEEGKIVLTDQHLKSVVEVSKDFKDYLNSLHRGDEAKRAERRNERLHDAIVKS